MSDIKPHASGELQPLLLCMGVAALVAIASVIISSLPVARNSAAGVIENILWLVPSVGRISQQMRNPESGEIILLPQWLFVPAYTFIWFYFLAPWSPRMRESALLKSRTLTPAKRAIGLPVAILFLVVWLLGDFGLIDFPTFYNGEFLYPPSHAVPQLSLIYASSIALAIYAWVGPLAEVCVAWLLCVIVLNAKIYFSPDSQ
jgi:hypothetical protein